MAVNSDIIRTLREKTGAGVMDCKKALDASSGDIDKAVEYLRMKGLSQAARKAGRATAEGLIEAYIHPGGKIGVLIEVNCETDFVARTDEFKTLVRDLSLQVAASNPLYLSKENVPKDIIDKELSIFRENAKREGKPDKVVEKIAQGRLEKFYAETCLLDQSFIKDPDVSISQHISSVIARVGENIQVRRFLRYQLGEGSKKDSAGA